MVTQSEAALEQGLIKTLQDMSYEYVKIEEETNLDQNFKTQLEKHNKKELARHGRTSFTDSEFEKIKIHLEGGTRFEKAKKLRDLFPLELETGERVWVEFLNRQQWCQNEFQVSNQITVEGRKKCRYDVTILINGLPLVQIELKKRGVELKQAYNQIQRYHKTSFHGLFDYIQLFVISNGVNTRYFANNPNSGYKFTFNWTDAENVPFNDLSKFALFFFDKCTLGKMISKYIVLHEGDKCLMVLRPYQYYAVEKILDRVQNSNKNGYIWHTTGAGKTLTSFKAAQLVSEIDGIDKVMFVVDRHDLDTQTQSEYEAFEPGAVDGTDNTYELIKRLSGKSKIIISEVLIALDGIDFGLNEASDIDILGDAYEYMIGQFAAGAGKKAGEFYTPQEVSQILADIVTTGKTRLKNVYDPTCGSGSLLLRTARNGKADLIYGQEKNPTTFNLARMNMLLHGVKFSDFDIENGDTLEDDAFPEEQFDAVVANPPFSAAWSAAEKFNNDDRFSKAGVLAPKSKADYAFILHMIHHLNEGGTMACVAPHGVLFRGASEGKIRRFLIEKKNYIDAIIGLPANIFYGTSIPTCIIVVKKCRKDDDNILFIDASKEFEKIKTQNKLRPEHIKKIVDTYRERKEIEKYSHLATLQEVADNDYNLNIPRYVDTFEEEEPIDIHAVMKEIKDLEAKRADLDKQIDVYLKELGLVE